MGRRILVIDDDETDVMFLVKAFEAVGTDIEIHHAWSGAEGLEYLRSGGTDLVLLDLKMPGTSGMEVLASIKVDDQLKRTPVIILSSSQSRFDVRNSYENAANAYVMKPTSMGGYLQMVDSLSHFWLDKVARAC
ncbi:response regulator [Oryzibacter oryziterrae]|uniref:response regulator n=1 Tax=Oryzibacter oryziterrae TaxID=2766474 RepID=UPI001F32911A|nr:response regulator [Oryzibacter oryziterrae]